MNPNSKQTMEFASYDSGGNGHSAFAMMGPKSSKAVADRAKFLFLSLHGPDGMASYKYELYEKLNGYYIYKHCTNSRPTIVVRPVGTLLLSLEHTVVDALCCWNVKGFNAETGAHVVSLVVAPTTTFSMLHKLMRRRMVAAELISESTTVKFDFAMHPCMHVKSILDPKEPRHAKANINAKTVGPRPGKVVAPKPVKVRTQAKPKTTGPKSANAKVSKLTTK